MGGGGGLIIGSLRVSVYYLHVWTKETLLPPPPLPNPLVTLYGKLIIFNAFYSFHRPVFSLKVKVAYENRKLAEKLKEKEKLVWEDGKMLLFSFILTTNYFFSS